jgi:hypothetical protein
MLVRAGGVREGAGMATGNATLRMASWTGEGMGMRNGFVGAYGRANVSVDSAAGGILPRDLGGALPIADVGVEDVGEETVYNIDVEGADSYFVTEADVLVHNEKYGTVMTAVEDAFVRLARAEQKGNAGKKGVIDLTPADAADDPRVVDLTPADGPGAVQAETPWYSQLWNTATGVFRSEAAATTPGQKAVDTLIKAKLDDLVKNGEVAQVKEEGNRYVLLDAGGNEVGVVARGASYYNQFNNQTTSGTRPGNMCSVTTMAMALAQFGINATPDEIYQAWRAGPGKNARSSEPGDNVEAIARFIAADPRYGGGKIRYDTMDTEQTGNGRTDEIMKQWLREGSVVQAATWLTPLRVTGHIVPVIGYDDNRQVWIVNDPAGIQSVGYGNKNVNGTATEYDYGMQPVGTTPGELGASGRSTDSKAIGDRRVTRFVRVTNETNK